MRMPEEVEDFLDLLADQFAPLFQEINDRLDAIMATEQEFADSLTNLETVTGQEVAELGSVVAALRGQAPSVDFGPLEQRINTLASNLGAATDSARSALPTDPALTAPSAPASTASSTPAAPGTDPGTSVTDPTPAAPGSPTVPVDPNAPVSEPTPSGPAPAVDPSLPPADPSAPQA